MLYTLQQASGIALPYILHIRFNCSPSNMMASREIMQKVTSDAIPLFNNHVLQRRMEHKWLSHDLCFIWNLTISFPDQFLEGEWATSKHLVSERDRNVSVYSCKSALHSSMIHAYIVELHCRATLQVLKIVWIREMQGVLSYFVNALLLFLQSWRLDCWVQVSNSFKCWKSTKWELSPSRFIWFGQWWCLWYFMS